MKSCFFIARVSLFAFVICPSLFSQETKAFYSLEEMTLEEKVGQLLMVHFRGETVNESAKALIQDTKVGGIIYYNWSNGLHSPEQVHTLSIGLQQLTKPNRYSIPLLIAADQEGGIVSRLNNGFTPFPGNRALGETSDPNLAQEAALVMGQELQSVGINMNLAPVVDVNSNPRNPVIGVRSFGEQVEQVLLFGEKALSGYKQANIIATLKHFPGHGDTAVDSHKDLPIVHKSKEELERAELLPFAKLAADSEAIMTAHILVPAFDTENCSTLSEKTLHYLRETIGFQGVIVSDSLVMQGVLKQCHTVDEAAIQALKAGCDLLILGGKLIVGEDEGIELTASDIQRIHGSLIQAVQTGRVSEAKVNQAVERILSLKNRYLNAQNPAIPSAVNTETHQALARKIASLALKMTQNESNSITSLYEKNVTVFAPKLLQNNIDQTTLLTLGKSTDSYFFSDLSPSSDEIEIAEQHAELADVLFICSYNAWKNPSQAMLIQSLLDMGKPTVLLVMRDSLDASLFPEANLIFSTFSPSVPSIQAICDQLEE